MIQKSTNKTVRFLQILLFFLGVFIIAAGIYATGPRLIQFITDHFSEDKRLSEVTISYINSLGTKIIICGALLIIISILLKYFVILWDLITRKIQTNNLIERAINSIGKFLSRIYQAVTKEKILFGIAVIILLGFLIPSIFLSPYGGFHVEGINLQPSKNLAEHGLYATLTTEGFDRYTYRISAGPGILLPDALVFKLFGVNIYYARALYVLFVLLAIFMLYYTVREVFDKDVALLALFLLIPLMPLIGNQAADAYIPGLFYFLAGAHFWFKSIENKKNIYLILGGLLWGLSFQTQWLFLFAIFAVVVTCIVLNFTNNGLKSKYYLVPSLMVILVSLIWTIFKIADLGFKKEYVHLAAFWEEHGHRAVGISTEAGSVPSIFSYIRPIESLVQIDIWRDFQFFIAIPAIIYLIILIKKSKWLDYRKLFFLTFTIIWFSWWLFFNYDLSETHFYVIIIMCQIFIAKFIYDLWKYSFTYKNNFIDLANNNETRKESTIFYLIKIVIICLVIGKTVFPLFDAAGKMYTNDITLVKPYHEMMDYINNNLEKDAIFSGWDWSMPWYIDLSSKSDRIIKNRTIVPFSQREKVPEYFIVSPEWPLVKVTDEWPSVVVENSISKRSNNHRKEFLEENCTLLKTFGSEKHKWLLYKVNNKSLSKLSQTIN